ncbi:MAG: hypothetical protein M0P19_08535 [Nevskia sp.]|nr:hypothetical protein [Nevskia sp.]MCK9383372.1 hypothetical protein [Nevskia sp.]
MRYSSSSASLTPATTSVADDLGNYNAVGLATQYTVEVNTDTTAAYNYTNTYKYDYLGFGGSYREARQQASITLPGYTSGTTTTTFDSHGNAIQIDNPNGEPKSQRRSSVVPLHGCATGRIPVFIAWSAKADMQSTEETPSTCPLNKKEAEF